MEEENEALQERLCGPTIRSNYNSLDDGNSAFFDLNGPDDFVKKDKYRQKRGRKQSHELFELPY